MKWMIFVFAAAWFAPALPGLAGATCGHLRVKAQVVVGSGDISLADLLESGACRQYRQAAAEVKLGAAPLAGTVRVLDGGQVRRRLNGVATASGLREELVQDVPARIEVQRGGEKKACAAIAEFAVRSLSLERRSGISPESFHCAGASSIPADAPLEMAKAVWNAGLQRWEFSLRCTRSGDCVPFLVWAGESREKESSDAVASARSGSPGISSSPSQPFDDHAAVDERLIKAGQTATLRWDAGGIRIVLPVTCLDSGTLGETVRVRFKSTPRILWAEILSDGSLWAGM